MNAPLEGVRVLDFSTLVPGPLATLILAEAGADVVKVERPGEGDLMRSYEPKLGVASSNFALLNRGKRTVTADLRSADGFARVHDLAVEADVIVEQFRPGVMDRLGLSYGHIAAANPEVVYCSITSFGQEGERALQAAHDLNFMALTGALSLVADRDGKPPLPITPFGDIAGGSYPAVVNILLGLLAARSTGHGTHIDVSMTDNLFTFLYWALGEGWSSGEWPAPNDGLVAGGTPRYGLYATSDNRYVAAAPLEDQFWDRFCDLVDLDVPLRRPDANQDEIRTAVSDRISSHPAAHWDEKFKGHDVCCTVVRTVEEATSDPFFALRGIFSREVTDPTGQLVIPALPVPLDADLRDSATRRSYPESGSEEISWLATGTNRE